MSTATPVIAASTDFTSVHNNNEQAVYAAVDAHAERYPASLTTPTCWLMWPAWR